jgi:hypothetical protein
VPAAISGRALWANTSGGPTRLARGQATVHMRDATLAAMPWPSHVRVLLAMALAAMSSSAATPPARAAVPRFGHVFLIVGENTSYEQITPRHAPFLNETVKPQGAWLANDRSFVTSSSLGEYVAMVSGQFTRCEGPRRDARGATGRSR